VPTAIVPELLVDGALIVIAPVVSVFVPAIVKPLLPVAEALTVKVPMALVGVTLRLTVLPVLITTLSVLPGVFPGKVVPVTGQPAPVMTQDALVPQLTLPTIDVNVQVAVGAARAVLMGLIVNKSSAAIKTSAR
jgi:hypothetical protein